MPPLPISSTISNCGKRAAKSATCGGIKPGPPPAVVAVCNSALSRHSGHKPLGALGASSLPQFGQMGVVSIFANLILLNRRQSVTENRADARDYGTTGLLDRSARTRAGSNSPVVLWSCGLVVCLEF